MLKITIQITASGVTFALEGKLASPWVKELELCWRSAASTQRIYPVRVDLSSVTFIDAAGKGLIGRVDRGRAKILWAGGVNKWIRGGGVDLEEKRGGGGPGGPQRESGE